MTDESQSLLDDPDKLKQIIAQLQARNLFLKEQFSLAQQQRFGASSEGHPAQGDLFNEAEAVLDVVEEENERPLVSAKKNPVRKKFPTNLPREAIVHDIDDKTCACCGNALHQMGDECSAKLEFIPAQVKVIEHVRLKYSCHNCEKTGTSTQIKIAPVPLIPIPKGIATATLLSQIITRKYQYALLLYRQESLFKQYGIELSRKTMADWMMKSSVLFKLLYERLRAILLQQGVIQADENTLKVINEDKVKSYMWLYCTGTDSPNPLPSQGDIPNIVLYDYQAGRAGQCAVDYLAGFTGFLHVDDYAGYKKNQQG